MTTNCILVLNAGSSSLKFAVYIDPTPQRCEVTARGQIEGLGTSPRFKARNRSGAVLADHPLTGRFNDSRTALDSLAQWLSAHFPGIHVLGVGHRVVHGGTRFQAPTRVSDHVLQTLRELIPLAPLHQPYSVAAVEAVLDRLPDIPQVACFDTSFHCTQPEVARIIPLPMEIRRRGVQRYGFHGLSYEYVASVLPRLAPEIADGRVIVAHLGNGASLCALRNGRSVDTTMGFTPLDGLCMGTRPGSVDPGAVLHLFRSLHLAAPDVENILYRQSGLLALSGLSSDMRTLLASTDPNAQRAVDYFVYRAAKEIGALAAALGGLDALVFTAGIGANSPEIRRRICESTSWLGLDLDSNANEGGGPRVSRSGSRVSAWAVATDEELMIAQHTLRLLAETNANR